MEKFLSIIIPVYNVENYLAECLDSCLEQDIPRDDYEIICVNDGSTDGSAAILERYAGENPNIQVITQPNGGVSAARNAGIDAARGAYIWFVDADDHIQTCCLDELRRAVTAGPADKLSFCHYEFENALSDAERAQADARTLPPTMSGTGYMIWEALFRRAFLDAHALRFREGISYTEDGLFLLEVSRRAPVTVSRPAVLYFYRRNPGSATRAVSPESHRRRTESAFKVAAVMVDFALEDLRMLREKDAGPAEYTRVLMPTVRSITISAAQLPSSDRREILGLLRSNGLFPLFLYRKPKDWFPKKIHMNHAHMGLKGKILDILYFYSTTRLGNAALVLYYKLRRKG